MAVIDPAWVHRQLNLVLLYQILNLATLWVLREYESL